MMDNEDLVSYYLKKSQDWIFIPQFRTVKIDDDEILDLDSMNLDSNEDTWLCSSCEKSVLKSCSESMDHEELEKEFRSNSKVELKKENTDDNSSPLSPLLGPEDFQHPSFLNSIDEMSDTALEDLLRTPLTTRSKATLLRKALTNSQSRSDSNNASVVGNGDSISNCKTTLEAGFAATTLGDESDVIFKKPCSTAGSESVAKSYILHSVENKLFNLADVNSTAELMKNRDLKNRGTARKTTAHTGEIGLDDVDVLCQRLEETKMGASGNSDLDANDENALVNPATLSAWHSTPHQESDGKPPSRRSFPQQPTPILLNRYLKHKQHQATEMSNLLNRHLVDDVDGDSSGDHHFGEDEEMHQPNEMNVSYVKYESKDIAQLPRIDKINKNGLHSSFSKSDDVLNSSYNELNSTYSVQVDDDAASSTSESSLSSISHKLTLSIQEVHKMADQQERSLKKQVYSSYYAGSSKSSEVSSSNESVSTYGVLSNSNEGIGNIKTTPKIVRSIQLPKQKLSYTKDPPTTCTLGANSRIGTYDCTNGKVHPQSSKLVSRLDMKSASVTVNETKPNLAFKSRISSTNGQYSNTFQNSSTKTSSLPTRPSTVPQKPPIPTQMESTSEIDSVKETRNTGASKRTSTVGPSSHIPRPASKIPMFRSSSSRNRSSKS